MELFDIKNRKTILTSFIILFLVIGFLMYPNIKYGEKFLDFSWWILSFNFLLLVTFAVTWFREKVSKEDNQLRKSLIKEMNLKLREELKEKDLKTREKIHKDIEELFILDKMFPDNVLLKTLVRSILLAILYILFFLSLNIYINQKFILDIMFANLFFLSLFLGSLYYLLKEVIYVIFLFKSQINRT